MEKVKINNLLNFMAVLRFCICSKTMKGNYSDPESINRLSENCQNYDSHNVTATMKAHAAYMPVVVFLTNNYNFLFKNFKIAYLNKKHQDFHMH